ncbi:hypothetical protein [uncultured Thiodictyon sp.]|uniref:hypothetical protein n=1 Tax=uncultured Thiodictyon sp. TaxID=1846217 RepID=UPI0025D7F4AA|nr:hypothetical protein [uncultured Thiodictyon sp.]
MDVEHLFRFLKDTQPERYAKLGIGDYRDKLGVARRKFLARLHTAISRRGTMCTALKGSKGRALESWFLPFNQGWNDGAGNPPNPDGIKTDYLWRCILTPAGLTDILENYAQVVEEINPKTGKKRYIQVFPRYHQLDGVRRLLAAVTAHGVGQRYLVQHSAGSGKSNSIAWLAHQLIGILNDGGALFDSIIVITDRRILDRPIRATIKDFAQVGSIIGAVRDGAGSKTEQLAKYLKDGKKIIICTVQTFPHVVESYYRLAKTITGDPLFALKRVITALFTDDAQLFKKFQDNQSFRHWLTDTMFAMTYEDQGR